jgi:hypothetical protein
MDAGRGDGGRTATADLGGRGRRGKDGNRAFGLDGVGGIGSERECILDAGDVVTQREGTTIGFKTGRRGGSCGETDEELGRDGIGGSSFCEGRPCVTWGMCNMCAEAESGPRS